MRRITWLWLGIAVTGLIVLRVTGADVQKEEQPDAKIAAIDAQLPASLQNYFPPETDQPVYLFRMLGMNIPFTGIIVDLFEKDIENAKANYRKFRVQYLDVAKLVPEWTGSFPIEPLNGLQTALETGDMGKIMSAVQQVRKVCSDCHASVMPKVQQRYFWGNFQEIRTTDPVTDRVVDNLQLMHSIDESFTGIEVDVEQGQIEEARHHFENFRARFQTMEETCVNCHNTERHYYVDASVTSMIDELGRALSGPSVDPTVVSKLSQGIGMESCFKCHLVHVPAAIAQKQMAR